MRMASTGGREDGPRRAVPKNSLIFFKKSQDSTRHWSRLERLGALRLDGEWVSRSRLAVASTTSAHREDLERSPFHGCVKQRRREGGRGGVGRQRSRRHQGEHRRLRPRVAGFGDPHQWTARGVVAGMRTGWGRRGKLAAQGVAQQPPWWAEGREAWKGTGDWPASKDGGGRGGVHHARAVVAKLRPLMKKIRARLPHDLSPNTELHESLGAPGRRCSMTGLGPDGQEEGSLHPFSDTRMEDSL